MFDVKLLFFSEIIVIEIFKFLQRPRCWFLCTAHTEQYLLNLKNILVKINKLNRHDIHILQIPISPIHNEKYYWCRPECVLKRLSYEYLYFPMSLWLTVKSLLSVTYENNWFFIFQPVNHRQWLDGTLMYPRL